MNKVILIMIITVLFWAGAKGFQKVSDLPKKDITEADFDQRILIEDILKEAKPIINQKEYDEEDLTVGPCLLNPSTVNEDYVVDVAHEPRTEDDKKPENQCSAFVEGNAKHFIEVDESGKLIRFQ